MSSSSHQYISVFAFRLPQYVWQRVLKPTLLAVAHTYGYVVDIKNIYLY